MGCSIDHSMEFSTAITTHICCRNCSSHRVWEAWLVPLYSNCLYSYHPNSYGLRGYGLLWGISSGHVMGEHSRLMQGSSAQRRRGIGAKEGGHCWYYRGQVLEKVGTIHSGHYRQWAPQTVGTIQGGHTRLRITHAADTIEGGHHSRLAL